MMAQSQSPQNDVVGSAQWYAVYTRARHEKMTATLLQSRGFPVFLPIREVQRELSAWRRKIVCLPLFPGYLFTQFRWEPSNTREIKSTHGVVSIVSAGRGPNPIPESQIISIQKLLANQIDCRTVPYLRSGREVRIKAGPMRGISGSVVRHKKKNLFVIAIDLLQRSVCVDIDFDLLEVTSQDN
jgi:transcription antitermination factor NusG